MTETPKQSDQLPEDGPEEVVPEAGGGAARESARRRGEDEEEIGYRENAEEEAYRREASR